MDRLHILHLCGLLTRVHEVLGDGDQSHIVGDLDHRVCMEERHLLAPFSVHAPVIRGLRRNIHTY